MRRNSVLLAILLAGLLFLSGYGQHASAQDAKPDYFPQTGHFITGEFLDYYRANPDAEFLFGYPITEQFDDEKTGRVVQYFQRARLEYYPEQMPGLRVRRTALGSGTYQPGGKVELNASDPACAQRAGWAYPVCFSFLSFYDEFDGAENFGAPISGLEVHGNRLMQFFEFARLEWRPELPPGQKITLGDLGTLYFHEFTDENLNRLDPVDTNNLIQQTVFELKVRAFTDAAVVAQHGEQTVYVTVHDQNLQPVNGARVNVILLYPNQSEGISLGNGLTNAEGLSVLTFPVDSQDVGMAELVVTVTYEDKIDISRAAFRIWY